MNAPDSSGRGSGWLLFGGPLVVFVVWAIVDNAPLFFKTLLNGLTLASLYFLVASGFTLVFGLMRNVNLAHGSLYLLGAYVGWVVGEHHRLLVAGRRRRASLVGGAGRPAAAGARCSASCRARTCARRWSRSACRSCWPT